MQHWTRPMGELGSALGGGRGGGVGVGQVPSPPSPLHPTRWYEDVPMGTKSLLYEVGSSFGPRAFGCPRQRVALFPLIWRDDVDRASLAAGADKPKKIKC